MKSVMQHNFSMTPAMDGPRSTFDRSHGYKCTFNGGQLIPFLVDEVLPGDTFNVRTAGFARLSTPLYPVMDNMLMTTHYFFCPWRLVWDNFEKFCGEQANPGDSTDFMIPQSSPPAGGYTEGSLQDYLGIPTQVEGFSHSTLIARVYYLIWNEWFRDENLQNSIAIDTGDGPDPSLSLLVANRGKRFDYFTQALPFPQKGPDVALPLGTTAPLIPNTTDLWFQTDSGTAEGNLVKEAALDNIVFLPSQGAAGQQNIIPNFETDLASASSATINEWRQAIALQQLYERDARSGTRYPEIIMSHYNVKDPMYAVLQRPQFLGSGTTPININPVASTSDINSVGGAGTVGELGAFGTASFNGHGFNHSFTEFGCVMAFVSVSADLTYQQGLNRFWSRLDRFDFFWPDLAHLGEQALLNKEIYVSGDPLVDDAVFGYVPRYDEYRHKNSIITGAFRSNAPSGTLDAWHLSQDFADTPTLDAGFITDSPPIDRVVVTPDEPNFIADFYHKMICTRPIPLYGTPGLTRF